MAKRLNDNIAIVTADELQTINVDGNVPKAILIAHEIEGDLVTDEIPSYIWDYELNQFVQVGFLSFYPQTVYAYDLKNNKKLPLINNRELLERFDFPNNDGGLTGTLVVRFDYTTKDLIVATFQEIVVAGTAQTPQDIRTYQDQFLVEEFTECPLSPGFGYRSSCVVVNSGGGGDESITRPPAWIISYRIYKNIKFFIREDELVMESDQIIDESNVTALVQSGLPNIGTPCSVSVNPGSDPNYTYGTGISWGTLFESTPQLYLNDGFIYITNDVAGFTSGAGVQMRLWAAVPDIPSACSGTQTSVGCPSYTQFSAFLDSEIPNPITGATATVTFPASQNHGIVVSKLTYGGTLLSSSFNLFNQEPTRAFPSSGSVIFQQDFFIEDNVVYNLYVGIGNNNNNIRNLEQLNLSTGRLDLLSPPSISEGNNFENVYELFTKTKAFTRNEIENYSSQYLRYYVKKLPYFLDQEYYEEETSQRFTKFRVYKVFLLVNEEGELYWKVAEQPYITSEGFETTGPFTQPIIAGVLLAS